MVRCCNSANMYHTMLLLLLYVHIYSVRSARTLRTYYVHVCIYVHTCTVRHIAVQYVHQ